MKKIKIWVWTELSVSASTKQLIMQLKIENVIQNQQILVGNISAALSKLVWRCRYKRDAVNFKAMWSKWLIWDGFGLSLSSEIVQVRDLNFHYYETIKFYEKHLFVSLNFKKVEIF